MQQVRDSVKLVSSQQQIKGLGRNELPFNFNLS